MYVNQLAGDFSPYSLLVCALDLHMYCVYMVNEHLVDVFLMYTSSLSVKSHVIVSGWWVLGYDVSHSFDASYVFSLLNSIVRVVNERRWVGHFDLCSLYIYMLCYSVKIYRSLTITICSLSTSTGLSMAYDFGLVHCVFWLSTWVGACCAVRAWVTTVRSDGVNIWRSLTITTCSLSTSTELSIAYDISSVHCVCWLSAWAGACWGVVRVWVTAVCSDGVTIYRSLTITTCSLSTSTELSIAYDISWVHCGCWLSAWVGACWGVVRVWVTAVCSDAVTMYRSLTITTCSLSTSTELSIAYDISILNCVWWLSAWVIACWGCCTCVQCSDSVKITHWRLLTAHWAQVRTCRSAIDRYRIHTSLIAASVCVCMCVFWTLIRAKMLLAAASWVTMSTYFNRSFTVTVHSFQLSVGLCVLLITLCIACIWPLSNSLLYFVCMRFRSARLSMLL